MPILQTYRILEPVYPGFTLRETLRPHLTTPYSNVGADLVISKNGLVIAYMAKYGWYFSIFIHTKVNDVWELKHEITTNVQNVKEGVAILDLSADGSILVTGDTSANGGNGYVSTYWRSGDTWNLSHNFSTDTGKTGLGTSVSISDDGLRMAITDANHSLFYAHRYYANQVWTIGNNSKMVHYGNFDGSVSISGDGLVVAYICRGRRSILTYSSFIFSEVYTQTFTYPNFAAPSASADGSSILWSLSSFMELTRKVGNNWTEIGTAYLPPDKRYRSSCTISADGKLGILGDQRYNMTAVYELSESNLEEPAQILEEASVERYDGYGWNMSLSSDKQTLVVSAHKASIPRIFIYERNL
jgi:hypothetical protein